MENKRILIIPVIIFLSLFIIGAYLAFVPTSSITLSDIPSSSQSSDEIIDDAIINGYTCVSTTGDFEGRKTPAGEGIWEELPDCNEHNLLYIEGQNIIRNMLSGRCTYNLTTISLCNATTPTMGPGNCSSPVPGQTEAYQNFTGCGLGSVAGTPAN